MNLPSFLYFFWKVSQYSESEAVVDMMSIMLKRKLNLTRPQFFIWIFIITVSDYFNFVFVSLNNLQF